MIAVAVCQYQLEKLSGWDSYVKKVSALVLQAKEAGAALLLLPEYSGVEIGGYHHNDAELYQAIQPLLPAFCALFSDLACRYQIYIQAGTILVESDHGQYFNRAYFFGLDGSMGYQDKLQLTAYEKQQGLIRKGSAQTVFDTQLGKIGIAVCYDSEFPEIVRRLVAAGAWLILVPSYTTSMAGSHRVTLSCRARALENQCYVAAACVVGEVGLSDPVELVVGRAGIYGPVDDGFAEDGIITEGAMNAIEVVTAGLVPEKLESVRRAGQVHNLYDAMSWNGSVSQPVNFTELS